MEKSLGNISVLVTRPAHQASGFTQRLEEAGGITSIGLPTIKIQYVKTDVDVALKSDINIFTSVNSVIGAHRCSALPWACPGKTAAIGIATARALKSHGVSVDFEPASGAGSEALLLEILNVNSKSAITIIRGDSGREKLRNSLTEAGSVVDYLTVYKRILPDYTNAELNRLLTPALPDIISVTSDLGLTNLLKIVPVELRAELKTRPLVVNSERCASLARSNGFAGEIAIADPPGDDGQVTEILRMALQLKK